MSKKQRYGIPQFAHSYGSSSRKMYPREALGEKRVRARIGARLILYRGFAHEALFI